MLDGWSERDCNSRKAACGYAENNVRTEVALLQRAIASAPDIHLLLAGSLSHVN
jgi:hypothetical protein